MVFAGVSGCRFCCCSCSAFWASLPPHPWTPLLAGSAYHPLSFLRNAMDGSFPPVPGTTTVALIVSLNLPETETVTEKLRNLLKDTDPRCTSREVDCRLHISLPPCPTPNWMPSQVPYALPKFPLFLKTLGGRYYFHSWESQVTCTRTSAPPCLMANPGNLQYHMWPLCFLHTLTFPMPLSSFIDVNPEKKYICQRAWLTGSKFIIRVYGYC